MRVTRIPPKYSDGEWSWIALPPGYEPVPVYARFDLYVNPDCQAVIWAGDGFGSYRIVPFACGPAAPYPALRFPRQDFQL